MYGEDATDVSSVRSWVCCFTSSDTGDRQCSDRPAMVETIETTDNDDTLIPDDRCITTSDLCTAIGIGKLAFMVINRDLDYSKVCVRRVLKMLIVEHRTASVQIFSRAVRSMEMLFCQE